jgi:uncharacterized protein YbjT (DUF2867 family)
VRVLVTGAYGLIGAACLARLHADGHEVVAAGRNITSARRRLPYAQWVAADFNKLADAGAWLPLLRGIDAVVNCVGVLQDGLRDDVQRVQLDGTKALFDGCVRAGVKRVIHISAIGAEPDGPSAFSRSKAGAEAYLKELALDWVILRPALVLGPAVYGGTAMLRGIAAFPGVVPVVHADARIQVIGLDDLTETVVRALAPDRPAKTVWEVTHPQVHRLADIVTAIRAWLGFRPRRVVALPDAIAAVVARLADALGWLGWRSPARSTSVAQLTAGVVGDPARWITETGIAPKGLEAILAARPAGVQDRWFARLYLLKPLAILGLALAAIIPSATSLAFVLGPRIASGSLRVFAAGVVLTVVYLLAGLSLLVRPAARCALFVLLVLTLLQLTGLWVRPSFSFLWSVNTATFWIPMLLAVLFTLGILDDR